MTLFEKFLSEPTDINEHLNTLRDLASECETVIEFGTRLGVSASALIEGRPKSVVCYDIAKRPEVAEMLGEYAKSCGVCFEFHGADDLEITVQYVDMIFIDTLHMYGQLKKELELHGNKATKYLVFHDTHTFGYSGELDRQDRGLMPAIFEFMAANRQWEMFKQYTNNNGLTILKRAAA